MGPREVIGRIHKIELVRKLIHRNETQEFNLYFGQIPVLDFIADHPGCTQVEIASSAKTAPCRKSTCWSGKSNISAIICKQDLVLRSCFCVYG